MTTAQTNQLAPQRPLRLWPGVIAVVLLWLAKLAVPFAFVMCVALGLSGFVYPRGQHFQVKQLDQIDGGLGHHSLLRQPKKK